jgi:hypothetical protein
LLALPLLPLPLPLPPLAPHRHCLLTAHRPAQRQPPAAQRRPQVLCCTHGCQ